MCTDIAKPLFETRGVEHAGRGRRMERRAAQAAQHQQRAERQRRRRPADAAQDDHRQKRPGDEEHTRPPAVGQGAEPQLRHRRRHLEAHRQRADGGQRQPEMRDEERQQRRVDVVVGVDDEMGRGQGDHARVEPGDGARRGGGDRRLDGARSAHSRPEPISTAYNVRRVQRRARPRRCGHGQIAPGTAPARVSSEDAPMRRLRAVTAVFVMLWLAPGAAAAQPSSCSVTGQNLYVRDALDELYLLVPRVARRSTRRATTRPRPTSRPCASGRSTSPSATSRHARPATPSTPTASTSASACRPRSPDTEMRVLQVFDDSPASRGGAGARRGHHRDRRRRRSPSSSPAAPSTARSGRPPRASR